MCGPVTGFHSRGVLSPTPIHRLVPRPFPMPAELANPGRIGLPTRAARSRPLGEFTGPLGRPGPPMRAGPACGARSFAVVFVLLAEGVADALVGGSGLGRDAVC